MTQFVNRINRSYSTVWRWHFYAGFFIAPFLIILAITGLGMVLTANTTGRDLDRTKVVVQGHVQPVALQAQQALNSVPHGEVVQYIAPRSAENVALFRVKSTDGTHPVDNIILIDPYTSKVVKSLPRNSNLYHQFDSFHSDMMLGKVGDYILETTAALTILMILTGWYLWWQKRQSLKAMLIPSDDSQTRSRLRTIHATLGSWLSILLLFFCVSGMAWAGIWGEKIVQAWSQFPAGKWGVEPLPVSVNPHANHHMMTMPLSKQPHLHGADTLEMTMPLPTHGEVLNDDKTKDVPWVLELTPMPVSGTTMGATGIPAGTPITIDSVDRFARSIGFVGRYQLSLPKGDTGVWTLSQDSMSYDMASPTADRTVHIDRYSGKVLADIRYDDYNFFGKFMAAGIAIHMGTLGMWSVVANVLYCLCIIAICLSGYVMWWQRRPSIADFTLKPPPKRNSGYIPWWFLGILLLVAMLFPTAIIAIVTVVVLDWLVISRLAGLQRFFK